jgi:DNA-binding response OmpR family regulator
MKTELSTDIPYHYRASGIGDDRRHPGAMGAGEAAVPGPAGTATAAGTSILLVDDDTELVALLRNYLEREGFSIGTASDGLAGVHEALSGRYAIAVIDVMMPRLNGIETLKRIRAASSMPVVMLTAKGDDTDRIIGLEIGADDYVPKPCTPRELTARIRAILRRLHPGDPATATDATIVAGALSVCAARRAAHWNGVPVNLTSTEFNLLEVLARNVGRPVSKKTLSEQALGRGLAPFDRSIDVHMSSIRQKLGQIGDGRSCIQTVYRQGYQLICD